MIETRVSRGIQLTDETRLAWLRLIRSENVGPSTFRTLINRYGGAQAALEALPDLAQRGGRTIQVASGAAAEEEMARAHRLGARFVCSGEVDYPAILAAAGHAPPVIAVMGSTELLKRPTVGVVGSRNASIAGLKIAQQLSAELGRNGHAIVSGLARGIDAAAHEASLDTGTAGIFAGGLDKPYPSENKPLMRRILDTGGCLISEMPFGWEPRARDFPRRNRIVAALSMGLLVVEAAIRSGSLISARLAGEMGRLVFAVPGSPLDPRASGTNRLLKDGAILVTEAEDIIQALRPLDARMPFRARFGNLAEEAPIPSMDEPVESERNRIVAALSPVPTNVDDIVRHTGASPGDIQLVLLELDLAGRLERHVDGRISLLP